MTDWFFTPNSNIFWSYFSATGWVYCQASQTFSSCAKSVEICPFFCLHNCLMDKWERAFLFVFHFFLFDIYSNIIINTGSTEYGEYSVLVFTVIVSNKSNKCFYANMMTIELPFSMKLPCVALWSLSEVTFIHISQFVHCFSLSEVTMFSCTPLSTPPLFPLVITSPSPPSAALWGSAGIRASSRQARLLPPGLWTTSTLGRSVRTCATGTAPAWEAPTACVTPATPGLTAQCPTPPTLTSSRRTLKVNYIS